MFSMFGFFSNSTNPSPNEEKPPALAVSRELTTKCSLIFKPKKIIELYRELNSILADEKNTPTQNPVLIALGTTVQSYLGLPTNTVFAEKAREKITHSINSYDFKELLALNEKQLEKYQHSHALSQEILKILRSIEEIVKEMPVEYITFENSYFKKGSRVKKLLEDTLEHYRVKLKEKELPAEFDNEYLCNIMKRNELIR